MWYEKAVKQGYKKAQTALGIMYTKGQGVTQDYVQAVNLFTQAAEQGDAKAQYQLGVLYSTGQGVIQDPEQASIWYQKAAEQKAKNKQ